MYERDGEEGICRIRTLGCAGQGGGGYGGPPAVWEGSGAPPGLGSSQAVQPGCREQREERGVFPSLPRLPYSWCRTRSLDHLRRALQHVGPPRPWVRRGDSAEPLALVRPRARFAGLQNSSPLASRPPLPSRPAESGLRAARQITAGAPASERKSLATGYASAAGLGENPGA